MTDRDPAAAGARPEVHRRVVLLGAGAVGVAGVLAACGGGDETTAGGETDTAPADPAPADTSPAESPAEDGAAGIVGVAEMPIGGGVIIAAEKVVVTQPAAGDFKAFGTTCTHQGCQVAEVADGQIKCPCHGSRYSIEDGSVQAGPAPDPLPEVAIAVAGDQVVLA